MKRILLLIWVILLAHASLSARPRIGVVLSGGGALGYAHIGALQALEEQGIQADCIAGSSMGALVGVMYAAGMTPTEIHDLVLKERYNDRRRILGPVTRGIGGKRLGFASLKHVRKTLHQKLPETFDSLPRRYFVCVTDITDSEEKIISHGSHLVDYVLASSSIPGVFEAIEIEGHYYVDGGVLNNLPAQHIRKECDLLIGVDVHPDAQHIPVVESILDVATLTLHTLMNSNSEEGGALCDHLIEPRANEQYKAFDFDNFEEIYKIGYDAMKNYLAAHPELAAIGSGRVE
ncbi:MAG: patatin-like phospholipase family protein [Rikenellaceae bacterium]|nr:patatin-like phospholipase family protein [Rikenellaceae bacterium]